MVEEVLTHRYRECGLDNIILVGATWFRCEECGEEYYNFGDVNQLHGLIAELLIKKEGLLIGKEIRFLRARLGYSGDMMARLMGYDKDHIYRIEREETAVAEAFDHFIRFTFINKMPDRYYDLHDMFLNGSSSHDRISEFKLTFTDHGWTPTKAA
jgi:DNA-binding XRE family transcriptional regulator